MFDRRLCVEPAIDKISTDKLGFDPAPPERTDWNNSLYNAWQPYLAKGRSRVWVVLMTIVKRLASPRSEEAADAALPSQSRREEAEPNSACTIFVGRLVLEPKADCNVVREKFVIYTQTVRKPEK